MHTTIKNMAVTAIALTCVKGYSIGKAVWGTFKSVLGVGGGKTVYSTHYPVGEVSYVVEDNKFFISFAGAVGKHVTGLETLVQSNQKYQLSITEMKQLYASGVDFEKVSRGYVKVTSPNDVVKDENYTKTTKFASFGILVGIIIFGFLIVKR